MDQTQDTSHLVLDETPLPGVRICILNRPTKRNALSQGLIDQLLLQLRLAEKDHGISSIIITGSGNFFSAGADIKEISQLDAESAHQRRYLEDLCNGMRSVHKPIIAAVEGKALGGGFELALMADFIVATADVEFGLPEVTIGLIPGAGGTQRLTSAIGKYRAMKLILLNEPLSGIEAFNLGLVSRLAESGQALEGAMELAKKLASQSPSAIRLAKEAICKADESGQDQAFERSLYYQAFGTKDKREGVAAFLEKRDPVWNQLS
ncbi:ClpP/crotonase-like domain-containing protein [Aspergillus granulosus]|uniref:ClpP/crotonase-like domain-containing protein n=1 Tax=Aspergillus granulosus TaxID=176169 RepID=A0ABR4H185_9EURO